ncbi:hypothetical protein MSG28_005128 [Choristoneura fumiferana]|uniref:Uncharacterized protein n=1 Tax=Choristoneura fumiferana TaxID=7141 RepID=A0ACC0JQ22_CHOFU|nr:hypothetical protein MSG28_005128 [Choristoneura fumiferana]
MMFYAQSSRLGPWRHGYCEELEGAALWGLRQLHVLLEGHQTPQLLQHGLDRVVALPPREDRDLSIIHLHKPKTAQGANYHASPVSKSHVIIAFEAPRNSSIAHSLLTLLKFFKKTKVPRNHCTTKSG